VPVVAVAARAVLSPSRLNVPDAARRAADEVAGAAAALVPWIRIGRPGSSAQPQARVVNAALTRRQNLPATARTDRGTHRRARKNRSISKDPVWHGTGIVERVGRRKGVGATGSRLWGLSEPGSPRSRSSWR